MKYSDKIKSIFSKKPIKYIAISCIILVLGVAFYKSPIVQNRLAANVKAQKTAVVKKGDVKLSVSGTGDIYYDKSASVVSKVSSKVSGLYFKEGDKVKAGDLICEFDDTATQLGLSESKNALRLNQLANSASAIQAGKLSIITPFSGQISDILVKKDDVLTKGAPLFTIEDTSILKLSVEFNSADIKKISINQPINVSISSIMKSVEGKVTYISNKVISTNAGGQLYTVEIQINNPGAISEDMIGEAYFETSKGTVASTNSAALEYISKTTVISETGGTVSSISIKKNQQISSGQEVIRIKNEDITINQSIGGAKIKDSQIKIASSENQLTDYKIYAPIDGIIAKQSMNIGDSVSPGEAITSIEQTNVVLVDVDIDEIDISKVAAGQKAQLTLDALSDTIEKPIEGEVIKIALNGTSKNGVTNFAVTIKVKERQNMLKGGMNVTAKIESESITNVLYVPSDAITKPGEKQIVTIKDDETDGIETEVQVGTSNESVTEIKSGLKEGDIIVLPQS
ncbi:efflux RND transporter periplasmic adaptor subunit [Clostridium sp.]|jgi:HlyD family secretion protein|uniref:efflux RND transporter periplasmic adaptor subunit n=1 Tax=Clostridium sp. TaxID=1506 RepID=UPI003EE863E3